MSKAKEDYADLIDLLISDDEIKDVLSRFRREIQRDFTEDVFDHYIEELSGYAIIEVPKLSLDEIAVSEINENLSKWGGRTARIGELYTTLLPVHTKIKILLKRVHGYIFQHPQVRSMRSFKAQECVASTVLHEIESAYDKIDCLYKMMDRITSDLMAARQAVKAQQENLVMIKSVQSRY